MSGLVITEEKIEARNALSVDRAFVCTVVPGRTPSAAVDTSCFGSMPLPRFLFFACSIMESM